MARFHHLAARHLDQDGGGVLADMGVAMVMVAVAMVVPMVVAAAAAVPVIMVMPMTVLVVMVMTMAVVIVPVARVAPVIVRHHAPAGSGQPRAAPE
ncbi:hypothetical protein [Arenibaculum pallidiluteum]|uniref:hypothetical protein n=1 Tax=Arenibaculum pallidiluteum TaxID=2812559 RepID=UPI001F300B46|nr:hypothetical protein [Arenibaculum pallidiluteum]